LYYSAGTPLEKVEEIFQPLLETMEKVWTKESCYLDMLWTLSIGIMLNVPLESIKRLEALVIREQYTDHLLDFLFRSVDAEWEWKSETFRMKQPYSTLAPILDEEHDDSVAFLKKYLEKHWYKPHRQMAWFDGHKRADYLGYWSFESGAIAKILGIEDSSLMDAPYYPYDLVHYKE
jgi:hypothetical protein